MRCNLWPSLLSGCESVTSAVTSPTRRQVRESHGRLAEWPVGRGGERVWRCSFLGVAMTHTGRLGDTNCPFRFFCSVNWNRERPFSSLFKQTLDSSFSSFVKITKPFFDTLKGWRNRLTFLVVLLEVFLKRGWPTLAPECFGPAGKGRMETDQKQRKTMDKNRNKDKRNKLRTREEKGAHGNFIPLALLMKFENLMWPLLVSLCNLTFEWPRLCLTYCLSSSVRLCGLYWLCEKVYSFGIFFKMHISLSFHPCDLTWPQI